MPEPANVFEDCIRTGSMALLPVAASFDRVDRRSRSADVYPHMDETIFLVVLGAFSILYAIGWFAISMPKGKRSEALSRIGRAIVALAAVPLRGR